MIPLLSELAPPEAPQAAYWRWETIVSLVLIAVLVIVAFVPILLEFIFLLPRVMSFLFLFVIGAFGFILGFSGTRQGGRANRIIATLAAIFHLLLMITLLSFPITP